MKWKHFLKNISEKQEEIKILNSPQSVKKDLIYPLGKISSLDGLLYWQIFPNISKRFNSKHTQTQRTEKRETHLNHSMRPI